MFLTHFKYNIFKSNNNTTHLLKMLFLIKKNKVFKKSNQIRARTDHIPSISSYKLKKSIYIMIIKVPVLIV